MALDVGGTIFDFPELFWGLGLVHEAEECLATSALTESLLLICIIRHVTRKKPLTVGRSIERTVVNWLLSTPRLNSTGVTMRYLVSSFT